MKISKNFCGIQHKVLIAIAITLISVTSLLPCHHGHDCDWAGTWSASVQMPQSFLDPPPDVDFEDQTVRQIVRISIGGSLVRVRLSNTYGATPLVIGSAHIAISSADAAIVADSDRELTFAGNSSVTIPVGGYILSDPVDLEVNDLEELAVSIYFPNNTGPVSWHELANQTTYVSPVGDFTSSLDMPVAYTALSWFVLSGIEVMAPKYTRVIVAFGDSITDGDNSTTDANNRWPDQLAERLYAISGDLHTAVLNAGISGNRVLNHHSFPFCGENALARFDRDALNQTGVTHVIFMEGINDIGFSLFLPGDLVSAEEIINGIRQIILRVHAQGLKIIGCTLTPFEGFFYYTPEGEAKRQIINEWIRTSGEFDGVVDFDVVLADPDHPTQLLPEYNSGDSIHPSDAGYNAMAEAVNLWLFRH